MKSEKLQKVLEFAIEREEESVRFYHTLQSKTWFSELKETLREFELVERSHILILQQIAQRDLADVQIPEVQNLKISDYLDPPSPGAKLNYRSLIITAMKREELSLKLYRTLARDAADPEVRKLFEKLAAEEARHKLHFETLYDENILKEN
jgi:rubrerythrin